MRTVHTEGSIAGVVGRQVLERRCVLLVDRCSWTGSECDVLAVTSNLRVIDVEIKVSRSDLKADARKDKWWQQHPWAYCQERPAPVALQWPHRVWKHYFAVPAAIWTADLLDALPSPACGVVTLSEPEPSGHVYVKCVRRALPNPAADRLTAEQVMAVARLANLRMWEAYAQRDAVRSQPVRVAA